MVWLLIESNVLRKIVILPSSTLKVRPSIRWFHILSFTTLPSLKMGALPPWNPGCRFNQARYRGWSYPSASPPIHSHPFAELRILSDVLLQVRQKYPQYHLGKIPFWYLQALSLVHFSDLFHFFVSGLHGRFPAQAGQKHTEFPLQMKFCTQASYIGIRYPSPFPYTPVLKTVCRSSSGFYVYPAWRYTSAERPCRFHHSRVQQYASNHC